MVEAYLDLITLVRRDDPDYLRDDDIATLAESTGLEFDFILNRVNSHLSLARS